MLQFRAKIPVGYDEKSIVSAPPLQFALFGFTILLKSFKMRSATKKKKEKLTRRVTNEKYRTTIDRVHSGLIRSCLIIGMNYFLKILRYSLHSNEWDEIFLNRSQVRCTCMLRFMNKNRKARSVDDFEFEPLYIGSVQNYACNLKRSAKLVQSNEQASINVCVTILYRKDRFRLYLYR